MKKNKFYKFNGMAGFLPLLALSGLGFTVNARDKVPEKRPNIVLIMADDMGYSDIGCYGSEIATPNIDRLAAEGLRFRNFYNNAKCCPTRASLLTGLYNHEAGMGNMVSKADAPYQEGPYQGFLNKNSVTLAEVLRSAGYSTYLSGKWHVGERQEHWPMQRGFDKYFGLISGACSYFEISKDLPIRQMAYGNQSWTPPAKGFYMTDALSDSAVAFIESHNQAKKDQPFFLYLAYTAPHWPLHALQEDIKKYEGVYAKGWDSIRIERYRKMVKLGLLSEKQQLTPRTPKIPAWDTAEDKDLWIRRMQVYAAMIDRMDQGIGRVIDTLKKLGKTDNTIIIFLSDNGGANENASNENINLPGVLTGEKGSSDSYKEPWANVSNTPYRYYKNWMHEGGIITPLIVSWPSVVKGRGTFTNQVGHVIDFMPTFLEVAGAKYPDQFNDHPIKPYRGVSLVPAFVGAPVERTEPLFWEHSGGQAMRQGDWKIVRKNNRPWELYNLDKDPTELLNLSEKETERLKKMTARYESWEKEVGVTSAKNKSAEE